jgi:hypothetical protein
MQGPEPCGWTRTTVPDREPRDEITCTEGHDWLFRDEALYACEDRGATHDCVLR